MEWSSLSIGNAAGFVKGPGPEFEDLLRSAVTDITIGSLTVARCDGNPGNVYHLGADGTSINALGLPNPGIDAVLKVAETMQHEAEEAGKRLRWSVAGSSPAEYATLADALFPYGELEINLGCPNVWGKGRQKPIPSFNLRLMGAILTAIQTAVPEGQKVDLKISPYSNPLELQRSASLFRRWEFLIGHLVACNTYPNGLAVQHGLPVLDTPGGYGGVAGNALHHVVLGQIAQFKEALKGTCIKIRGVGGVDSGIRLLNMIYAGAHAVQVGTAFGERKGRIFSELLEDALG